MGCCLSAPNESIPQKQEQISSELPQKKYIQQNVSKSPPRAEEEAVKEVLTVSETPNPKPKSPRIPKINKNYNGFLQQSTELSPSKLKNNNSIPKIPTLLDHSDQIPEVDATKYSKLYPVTHRTPTPLQSTTTTTLTPLTPDEISEVSDLCSVSESVSTKTVSHTDRRGEDDDQRSRDESEVCQRIYRSPAKSYGYRNGPVSGPISGSMNVRPRERTTGRSPVRRSDPSPTGRRNARAVTRTAQGNNVTRRGGGGFGVDGSGNGYGQRKDFGVGTGEQSNRRSRSPARNRNNDGTGGTVGWNRSGTGNMGRSPSARKTGPSPSRVRMVQPTENARKLEETQVNYSGRRMVEDEDHEHEQEEEEKWASNASTSTTTTTTMTRANNDIGSCSNTTPTESLENPLVSLECFIFL